MYRLFSLFLFAVLVFQVTLGLAWAQTPPPLADQVEEDWQLVVTQTDYDAVGPQITTTMSPTGDVTSSAFVAFDLNYREYPDFRPGGLQVQVWSGQGLVNQTGMGSDQLNTPNETITWTQRMKLSAGQVQYSVVNGQSTTWGQFGQADDQQLNVSFATTLTSLTSYDPAVSVAKSGVGWQKNYVTSMTLVQVRYYAAGKLIATDATARAINLSD